MRVQPNRRAGFALSLHYALTPNFLASQLFSIDPQSGDTVSVCSNDVGVTPAILHVSPSVKHQKIIGFGGAFTEGIVEVALVWLRLGVGLVLRMIGV